MSTVPKPLLNQAKFVCTSSSTKVRYLNMKVIAKWWRKITNLRQYLFICFITFLNFSRLLQHFRSNNHFLTHRRRRRTETDVALNQLFFYTKSQLLLLPRLVCENKSSYSSFVSHLWSSIRHLSDFVSTIIMRLTSKLYRRLSAIYRLSNRTYDISPITYAMSPII